MNPQNQQLIEYIKAHSTQGASPETIKTQLLQAGWDALQVDQAISQVNSTNTPSPQPAPDQSNPVSPQPNIPNGPTQTKLPSQNLAQVVPSQPSQYGQPAYQQNSPQFTTVNNPASPKNRKKLFLLGGVVVLVLALIAASYFLFLKPKTPEQVFEKMQSTNMKSSTFTQKFTTEDKTAGSKVVAISKTDFSKPAEPKSDVSVTMNLDDANGKLEMIMHLVQIGDQAYLNYEKVDFSTDDPATKEYLKQSGGFYKLLGIEKLNSWIKLKGGNPETDPDENDIFGAAAIISPINTVLGSMPIGNFGDKAKDFQVAIMETYTIDYAKAVKEDIAGKKAMKFEVKVDKEKNKAANEKYGMELNLSAREIDLINKPKEQLDVDGYTVWVDLKTYHPLKVEVSNDLTVEYSDFGEPLDIKAPI